MVAKQRGPCPCEPYSLEGAKKRWEPKFVFNITDMTGTGKQQRLRGSVLSIPKLRGYRGVTEQSEQHQQWSLNVVSFWLGLAH